MKRVLKQKLGLEAVLGELVEKYEICLAFCLLVKYPLRFIVKTRPGNAQNQWLTVSGVSRANVFPAIFGKFGLPPAPFLKGILFFVCFFFWGGEKVLGGKERTLTDGVAQLAPREIFDPSLGPSLGERERAKRIIFQRIISSRKKYVIALCDLLWGGGEGGGMQQTAKCCYS